MDREFISHSLTSIIRSDEIERPKGTEFIDRLDDKGQLSLYVERFLTRLDVEIIRGDLMYFKKKEDPCFYEDSNAIYIPLWDRAIKSSNYYAILFHELIHWTGSYLGRDKGSSGLFFMNQTRHEEEIIAALGSAALLNYFNLPEPSKSYNNWTYAKIWMQYLIRDYGAISEESINRILKDTEQAVNFILDKGGNMSNV
jgi:antirestriction protein ArdC